VLQSADNANELVQQQSEPGGRYVLKVDTDPDRVVITSDMVLLVGSRRGHVLAFNLRCIAYLGGQSDTPNRRNSTKLDYLDINLLNLIELQSIWQIVSCASEL